MKRYSSLLAMALCAAVMMGLLRLKNHSRLPSLPGKVAVDEASLDSKDSRQNGTGAALPVAKNLTPEPPSALAVAVGKSQLVDFRDRLSAVSSLSKTLSVEHRHELYGYLRNSTEEKFLRPGQADALKNDILNVLREQEDPPRELTDVLSALWREQSLSLVIRDYALQHLAAWHGKARKIQQDQIVQELGEAAAQIGQSFAGTALIGLHRIRLENPGLAVPSLNDQIARLVQDETAHLLARITAVQLAGEEGAEALREPLEWIAAGEVQPPTLRIAALASLGRLGGGDAGRILTPIAEGTDIRLASVARSALSRLSHLKPSASSGQ